MIKFVIISIVLTWVWMWLFKKIVIEENESRRMISVVTSNSTTPVYIENALILHRPSSYNINQNPLIMMWFGSFTYLMAKIWKIWLNYLFGYVPPELEENANENGNPNEGEDGNPNEDEDGNPNEDENENVSDSEIEDAENNI